MQRYVSKELIHLVGGKKQPLEAQYKTLKDILRSGWLSSNPTDPGKERSFAIMPGGQFSENRVLQPFPICFCDIPVEDIGIHAKKYGLIGLSFQKSFLIPLGVNPVFYVANESKVRAHRISDGSELQIPRSELLDELVPIFWRVWVQRRQLLNRQDLPPELREHLENSRVIDDFLMMHVLGFMKHFDTVLDDDHPDNFYMEREWRATWDLKFELKDVWRVILPKEYGEQLRKDFPEYCGQVTFSEGAGSAPSDAPPEQGVTEAHQSSKV